MGGKVVMGEVWSVYVALMGLADAGVCICTCGAGICICACCVGAGGGGGNTIDWRGGDDATCAGINACGV